MRVAVVHSFYSSSVPSGENTVVEEQVQALSDAGHVVTLLDRRTDDLDIGRSYKAGATWTTITGRWPSPHERLEAFRPDVVHLHNSFPNWGTAWLDRWSTRTVATMHNFRTVCAAGTLFRSGARCDDCLRRPILPAVRHKCYHGSALQTVPVALAASPLGSLRRVGAVAGRVVALNEHAQQLFSESFGRRVDLIPNFVRATRPLTKPSRGWLYVGRLSAEKGILELLRDWPAGEPLDVFGSGPLESKVQERCAAVAGAVFQGGIERRDLLSRLPTYAGLVVPSLWAEGLPTVLLEALASGVPVVVSRHVAAAASLQAEGAAVVYDPDGGLRLLTDAMGEVSSRSGEIRRGAAALHRREYSIDAWLPRIEELYEELAHSALRRM
jgi:glycosyltransferase involved in cell wall biosynthesis